MSRTNRNRSLEPSRATWVVALALLPIATACIGDRHPRELRASRLAAVDQPGDCGYNVTAEIHGVSKKGFAALVRVTNVSGVPSTVFSVLVDAGTAQLVHVAHGSFAAVEGGYLLTPLDALEDAVLDVGQSYTYELKLEGEYTTFTPYILSNNGVACDQTPPDVKLSLSGTFFTANGTLTLSAAVDENVAVAKVVFLQDGQEIGVDWVAPYTLDVPITAALNGRRQLTARAYDVGGNVGAMTKSVLVAIGNKFFGTAATYPEDYTNLLAHFDQLTPGNAGKWGTVEATRDQMVWGDLDTAYTFAKAHGLPFKLHTLVWGSQQPGWLKDLPPADQLAELEEWMAALAERYPEAAMVDVVNEPLHAKPSYAAALGDTGTTGWDWVIRSFELARTYFPKAELILNEYSVLAMTSTTDSFLALVQLLADRGLIDGIGEQGHFYERTPDLAVLGANLGKLAATGLPIYISELDLNLASDEHQALRMSQLFALFWSHPSVVGITHWGYLQGKMWQPNAYLLRADGTARPALTWIECTRAGRTDCTLDAYVPPTRTGDLGGITLEAEELDTYENLLTAGNTVAYASDGSWFGYASVAFDANWDTLSVTYANGGGAVGLSVLVAGTKVATVPLAPTGGWGTSKTVSLPWAPITGKQSAAFQFVGGGANVDKVAFSAPTGAGKNLLSDSDFEAGTIGGWWTWGTGTIANITLAPPAAAVSGTHALAMTGRTGGAPLVQTLTSLVTPGTTYKISLWATIGGASASAGVSTAVQCSGGTTQYGRLGGWGNLKTLTEGTWVEFAGELTLPSCALGDVKIYLEGPATQALYIDHVSVRAPSGNGPTNLIPDGTFESGQGAWGGWGAASIAVVTPAAHDGTHSLLGTTMSPNGALSRDIKGVVTPGKKYTATAWVTVGTANPPSLVKFQTVQACNGGGDGYPWLAGASPAPGAWQQVVGTVDLTGCATIEKLLLFVGADSGDLYVDDVTLIALP